MIKYLFFCLFVLENVKKQKHKERFFSPRGAVSEQKVLNIYRSAVRKKKNINRAPGSCTNPESFLHTIGRSQKQEVLYLY